MAISTTNERVMDVVEQRADFLECLATDSKAKRALVDETNYSRSTIDRGIRELETLDLVEYSDGEYQSALCGALAADAYRQFAERIDTICRLQPFLKWIPADSFDLELRWLTDAALYTPEPGDPYAMINHHVEQLKNMNEAQALLPYTGQHATEAAYERIVQHGAEGDVIVQPDVAETFLEDPRYAEFIEDLAATGRFHIFEYDGTFPYAVSLFDDETVQILVDEDEEPRAMVETDHEGVRAWATRKIEQYKQQSEQLL